MSLINDALKRVRQLQSKSDPPANSETPLQPVENQPARRKLSPVVLAGCGAILVLACWFMWQWWAGQSKPTQVASSVRPATNQARTSTGAPPVGGERNHGVSPTFGVNSNAVPRVAQALPTNAPSVQSNANLTVAHAPAAETEAPISPTGPEVKKEVPPKVAAPPVLEAVGSRNVVFPPLTLQGIYLRIKKPSALINNRTLFLGDEIEGARVVGIDRFTVKMEMKGQFKELSMNKLGESSPR